MDGHDRLLKRVSTNSSLAPSYDPPFRQQRRARERERAKQQGRKQRGGQPGHEGKTREMVAPGGSMITLTCSGLVRVRSPVYGE